MRGKTQECLAPSVPGSPPRSDFLQEEWQTFLLHTPLRIQTLRWPLRLQGGRFLGLLPDRRALGGEPRGLPSFAFRTRVFAKAEG